MAGRRRPKYDAGTPKQNGGANLGFEEKMERPVATLEKQFAESERLEAAIRRNLQELGFGR